MGLAAQVLVIATLLLIILATLYYGKLGDGGRLAVLLGLPALVVVVALFAWTSCRQEFRQAAAVQAPGGADSGAAAVPAAQTGRDLQPLPGSPAVSTAAAGGGMQDVSAIYQRIGPSVVVIHRYDDRRQLTGIGTGFFVSAVGDVVTNHHVLRGASQAEVKTSSGKVYPVRSVLAEDPDNDLIMISVQVSPCDVHPLSVRPALPAIGEKIVVIGSPLGLDQTVSDGIVSAVREIQGARRVIQITAPISPGSSGSPVVNMRGEVVAVACALIANGQNLNFGIPSEKVAALSAGSGYPLSRIARADAFPAVSPDEEMRKRVDEARRKAEEEQKKMLEERRRAREKGINEANDHIKQGNHHMSFGRYLDAFYAFEKALQICRQLDDVRGMAFCVESMGIAMEKYGRHDIAQDYYRQAAALRAQRVASP